MQDGITTQAPTCVVLAAFVGKASTVMVAVESTTTTQTPMCVVLAAFVGKASTVMLVVESTTTTRVTINAAEAALCGSFPVAKVMSRTRVNCNKPAETLKTNC